MSIAVAILAFGILIAIHEAGHFLAARWAGMRVDMFSIGFGPAIAAFRRGETQWRIGLLPLGGFVRIAGMNPDDVEPDDPRSFANKPAWKRLLVIVAGALMNYALAWVLLVVLLVWGASIPDMSSTRIQSVDPGGAAAAAGLEPGDRILSVGGREVAGFRELAEAVRASAGQPVEIRFERGGETLARTVTPSEAGFIGVRPSETIRRVGPGAAIVEAFQVIVRQSVGTLQAIGNLITGRSSTSDLMGPVGIASVVAEQAARGLRWLLGVVISVSIALGLFNLLPIPALDGGRAAFLLVEMVRRKPMNARAEMMVHFVGMVLLLGLILLVTVGDVGRLMQR